MLFKARQSPYSISLGCNTDALRSKTSSLKPGICDSSVPISSRFCFATTKSGGLVCSGCVAISRRGLEENLCGYCSHRHAIRLAIDFFSVWRNRRRAHAWRFSTGFQRIPGFCSSIEDARQVFDKMSERNVFLWIAIIASYGKHCRGKEAFQTNVGGRLNDLIAKNRSLQEFLENENFNIQTTNVLALREMEEEIMRMEITIRDCNKEKDEIDREVQELQHHISLWTSKISFEKKTQETLMQAILSPMAIAGAMKSDLEKLKSKLNDLTSIRQKIIVALESKVSDRNALSIKAKATSSKKDFEGPVGEEAVLIKTVGELRRILREMQRSMITIDGRVEALHKKKLFLASKVSELDSTILTEVKKQEELRTKLREAIENKSIKLMDTALKQRMVKRYYMVKENKWKVQLKFSLEVELGDSQRKCNILVELLKSFIYDLPQLQAKLESIFLQLDCVQRL